MKTKLDVTARDFLNHFRLPMSHPLCGDSNTDFKYGGGGDGGHNASEWESLLSQIGAGIIFELPNINAAAAKITASANMYATATHVKLIPPPSTIGSTSLLELHDRSISEALLTATNMSAPSLAMTELWLRLFAIFLGPLCLVYWVHREVIAAATAATAAATNKKSKNDNKKKEVQDKRGGEDDNSTSRIPLDPPFPKG